MMNYEILISISLGDNFPLQDEFLSKDCKTSAILEAKFNEEVLQSDPIEIISANPELATELGFRLHKKDFHQFRIERKSIKLQCFIEYSTLAERNFIGYVILHLRDAQEYTQDPKYKWHVLLNPKYKGSSMKRPQLYLAFMVNKLKEDDLISSQMSLSLTESQNDSLIESHFSRPLKKEHEDLLLSSFLQFSSPSNDLDSNLKVKLKNKSFYIWDENICSEKECNEMFSIQIEIDKPINLGSLLGNKSILEKCEAAFYFKYLLLGKQIKTSDFFDIFNCNDFKKHKFIFHILTYDKKMIKNYFESYPTIEVQFFCGAKITGFVTVNFLRLFENNLSSIEGEYMIVPEDESVYVKEPFPVVYLSIVFTQVDNFANMIQNKLFDSQANSIIETSINEPPGINHYYIAIDLRTIRLENPENCQILLQPFYLQFSYAFFGITDYIKTYPSIRFLEDNPGDSITIPHGFCGFNFATTQEKLLYTFANIPFLVQLILEKDDTLLGTAELDLSCLFQKQVKTSKSINDLNDNFVNTFVYVQDELNDRICEIQVVMFLQEIQNLSYVQNIKEIDLNPTTPMENDVTKKELINSLNDMIIETAHDIELWKEEQMKHFKNRLKQKEIDFLQSLSDEHRPRNKDKNSDSAEENVRVTLENLTEKERIVCEKEIQINVRQKELDEKFYTLSQEIDDAIHEVRIQYEEKANMHRDQLRSLEQDKHKCQERIYQLERKVKEKDHKIKELEGKLFEQNQAGLRKSQNQRATSLTRNVSANSRKIIITRDSDPLSKSMIENKFSDSSSIKPVITSKPPPMKPRFISPTTNKPISNPDLKSVTMLRNEPIIIEKIKKERQELIKRGVSVKDPLIIEIDKRLKNYRLHNTKRI